MAVSTHVVELQTRGFADVHDITQGIQKGISESGIRDGIVCVSCPGSTGGITTIEFESGVVNDLRNALERMAPQDISYDHDARWGDGNGFSHVRSALLGASVAFPVRGGQIDLGTWQQIVFIDFDNRPRSRRITVQVVGE
jgi:secondary thiamine-phosphate synthase enzyme